MIRKGFYNKLNGILDICGDDIPKGSKRRPFLAYSWKKYKKNNLNLADISKFEEIKKKLKNSGKWGTYIGLILHRQG